MFGNIFADSEEINAELKNPYPDELNLCMSDNENQYDNTPENPFT